MLDCDRGARSVESELSKVMVPMAEKIRGRPLPYLRAWRMRKFMSQVELVEGSGLARATVARAEKGDEVVSYPNIRKLAAALGISPDDLLRNPEEGETRP